jgi:hypothetical protein
LTPKRLSVGAFQVVGATAGAVRVVGYSDYDPIEVPSDLIGVLHYFDGGSTDDAFLRTLVAFEVLVDAT